MITQSKLTKNSKNKKKKSKRVIILSYLPVITASYSPTDRSFPANVDCGAFASASPSDFGLGSPSSGAPLVPSPLSGGGGGDGVICGGGAHSFPVSLNGEGSPTATSVTTPSEKQFDAGLAMAAAGNAYDDLSLRQRTPYQRFGGNTGNGVFGDNTGRNAVPEPTTSTPTLASREYHANLITTASSASPSFSSKRGNFSNTNGGTGVSLGYGSNGVHGGGHNNSGSPMIVHNLITTSAIVNHGGNGGGNNNNSSSGTNTTNGDTSILVQPDILGDEASTSFSSPPTTALPPALPPPSYSAATILPSLAPTVASSSMASPLPAASSSSTVNNPDAESASYSNAAAPAAASIATAPKTAVSQQPSAANSSSSSSSAAPIVRISTL